MKEANQETNDIRFLKLEEKMNLLVNESSKLRFLLEDLCHEQCENISIPHRCPCCNGTFLDEDGAFCLPCDGRGIVWS